MNKQRRNEITYLKYKKRIKRWVSNCSIYHDRNNNIIYNPKTIDVLKDRGQLVYKTQAVPCSCWMCSKYWKYKRHLKKQEDRKLIQENLKEYYQK
jgi:hypothetical protein